MENGIVRILADIPGKEELPKQYGRPGFRRAYFYHGFAVFYAAMSHLAALYCLICSYGAMISKGLLSLSIANIMLHTLCEIAPAESA